MREIPLGKKLKKMIFKKIFRYLIAKTLGLNYNKYHPLVWIVGKPEIGDNVYIGGFSEANCNKSSLKIGKNFCILLFWCYNCRYDGRIGRKWYE